MGLGNFTIK